WGYRTYKTQAELQRHYRDLIINLQPLLGNGLAAAIYTQTTDVEGEVNGLMTYDRAIINLDVDKTAQMHQRLYRSDILVTRNPVVPTSEEKGQMWKYTNTKPADAWIQPAFDDGTWNLGEGGFGTKGTPGSVVRTEWKTDNIWLRRTFELKNLTFTDLYFRLHHDEDVEVYINGKPVLKRPGFVGRYIEVEVDAEARKALKMGVNTLAVHCKQTTGGQYIDV